MLASRDDRDRAVEEYRLSIAAGTPFEPVQVWTPDDEQFLTEPLPGGALSGAQANNLALLLSLDGEDDEAVSQARAAVFEDPASSVFTDTLAYAHQRAGQDDEAIAAYRRVLRADPTAYVSANNLGVLLADAGEWEEAEDSFGQAVAIEPDVRPGLAQPRQRARGGLVAGRVRRLAGGTRRGRAAGLGVPRRRAGLGDGRAGP